MVKGGRLGRLKGLGQGEITNETRRGQVSRKLPLRKLRNRGDYKTYCMERERGGE